MNNPVRQLGAELQLDAPGNEGLALAFGQACVGPVAHLLEIPETLDLYRELADAVLARKPLATLADAAARAAALARSHRGSASLDGSGHSAVSATHALARALHGDAMGAAEYAAYAKVYAYGRYAVDDPEMFAVEFNWQLDTLRRLHAQFQGTRVVQERTKA
jgi:hypothetical protein